MSTGDSVDASDIMTNGHEASGVTRIEAFGEEKLERLRDEATRMVQSGAITIDDLSLEGRTGDGVQLADGENQAFRDDVRSELGDAAANAETPEQEAEQGEGWDPTEVDFYTIWNEYDFPERVSNTQLVNALAYSDHTGFKKGGAERAIDYGVEAGTVIDIPRRLPDDSHGDEVLIDRVMYARGDE